MDDDVKFLLKILALVAAVLGGIEYASILTTDYSDTEASVKVQEVGTRYAWLWFGEQSYIRVQNAYSEQFTSSSESWETCIDERDLDMFRDIKNNKTVVNIRVKGYGWSNIFNCVTGDRVIEVRQ